MNRYVLLFLALVALLLDGCGSAPLNPRPDTGVVDTQPVQPDEMHCRIVARERADDALANGYGFEIEASVYRETYDECMAWRSRGKPG
jgi:hypothetical protein